MCGIVLALGLAGSSPPNQSNTRQQLQTQQKPPPAAPVAPTQEELRNARLGAACKQDEDNRSSDLCAQWRAADSAYEGSIWTRRTGWLTGIDLLVGFATMVAAIFAAIFAKDAARHTKAGADAAWAAEKVTRESAERQLRAYIHPADVRVSEFAAGSRPTVYMTVQNHGQTPAYNVVAKAMPKIIRVEADLKFVFPIHFRPKSFCIAPNDGSKAQFTLEEPISNEDYADIMASQSFFIYGGVIRYTDFSGRRRRTIFKLKLHPTYLRDGCAELVPVSGKNHAS